MNICSPQLGLSKKSILGGEVFDFEILSALARKGVKVNVLLPKNAPHSKIRNIHYSFSAFAHFPAVLFNLLVIPYLLNQNSKNKIEIIRLHQPQFVGLAAMFFKLFNPNVKIVATYHQSGESNFTIFSKIVNRYWDHIICDSFAVKEKLVTAFDLSENKITVVHNGIPQYLRPGIKDKRLFKKYNLLGQKVLLYMGLFIDRKNPLFLLSVLKELNDNGQKTVLMYWGRGPLKSKIIREAKKLGLENKIIFVNPMYGAKKRLIHNLADVFVHPALDEGFALTPLEAMACGKPVIMNSSHSAKEAVDNNVNGFLCKTNNVDSWTQAINSLLTNNAKLLQFGKSSRKKAIAEFNWKKSTDKHFKVFKNLTSC